MTTTTLEQRHKEAVEELRCKVIEHLQAYWADRCDVWQVGCANCEVWHRMDVLFDKLDPDPRVARDLL